MGFHQTVSADVPSFKASKVALRIRGGALSVDDEGNFYSPKQSSSSTFLKPREQEVVTSASDSSVAFVRGNGIDVLCAASSVRGGNLCVDNEGNFYSPRRVAEDEEVSRSSPSSVTTNSNHKNVVLAKTRRRKRKKTD